MNGGQVLEAALAWHDAGATVIPTRADGTKAPAVNWRDYQTARPEREQVAAWMDGSTHDGFGLVCGAVSSGLEMLELEGRAVAEGLLAAITTTFADHGLTELWQRVVNGYCEATPSGGLHWLIRVDGPCARNLKLARRPATADELAANPAQRITVLAETRGEGGYVVVAPSAGRTHPTGKAWTVVSGGPTTVPLLTVDERDTLYALIAMHDQTPAAAPAAVATGEPAAPGTGTRPGDDYNARATWDDILTPRGWTAARRLGRGYAWRRPGKNDPGISATTGQAADGVDRLYVFSTSTEFEAERPYTKFAAYALLEHDGDYGAAARALSGQGYGEPPNRPVLSLIEGGGATAPATAGSSALAVAPAAPGPQAATTLEFSEDGHAVALVDTYGERIRYCHERGRWLVWDGARWSWQPRGGGLVREYAKDVVRALDDHDRAAAAHKKRSLSASGTSGALTQAATDPRIVVRLEQLDAHAWELNTPGGILDLRTGALRPPDPDRLHTRMTTCTPDPAADAAAWSTFLEDTFGGDEALVAYLARLLGYSAVGTVREHVLPFGLGTGANGKTVLLETIAGVLGDYATSAPSGFLMASAHSKHETEIARLSGARFVICSEVNEDDRFDEAKVKLLTGGDRLTARFMRDDHFTFTPTHHLWLVGNSQPAVRAGGLSFWRRVRLIRFEHTVPEERRIDDLAQRLITEHGPAVLAWLAAGAADYAASGLREPAAVTAATEGYARDSDTVGRFVDECLLLGGGEMVKATVASVRGAYERWCSAEGEHPVTAKALTMALASRFGVDSTRNNRARFYLGVALVGADEGDENLSPDASPRGWDGDR